jgi:tRNA A-37 threonylcarbamoyl transferase component Bud32
MRSKLYLTKKSLSETEVKMLKNSLLIQLLEAQVNSPFFIYKIEKVELLNNINRRLSTVGIYSISLKNNTCIKVCVKRLSGSALVHNEDSFLEQEYNNHSFLYNALESEIILPEVYCYDATAKVMITKYIEHKSTYEKIYTNPINWFIGSQFMLMNNATKLIAKNLTKFHSIKTEDTSSINSVNNEEIRDYLQLRIDLIFNYLVKTKVNLELRKEFQQLTDYVSAIDINEICINSQVIIHGDFTPANLFHLSLDDVAFIDFADVKKSCLTQDIACFQNYILMLTLNKFWFRRSKAQKLIDCFEEYYWLNSPFKQESQLLAVFRFRMLLTNTLTLVYECEKSKLKSMIFSRKLARYIKELISFLPT